MVRSNGDFYRIVHSMENLVSEAFSYRHDPAVPKFPDDRPIIIFDGKCVLCSGFAQFVLRHDKRQRFRLMAAQTSIGEALYRHLGLDPKNYQTNILLEDGYAWFKSEGSIRMFVKLGLPWSLVAILRVVPVSFLDKLYAVVARNRLRWFGVRETCLLMDATHADRFIV